MKLQRHLDGLQEDLEQLAGLGDDAVAEAAARLAAGLGPTVRMRVLDVLAEAALELSESSGTPVDVRLAGGDPELVLAEAPPPAREIGEGQGARITLRLPEDLKTRVEQAAAAGGVSANAWIVNALAQVASSQARRTPGGRRLTGHGRS
jgi:hypothetical protein